MKTEPGVEVIKPGWDKIPRVKAFCTTRKGGSSQSPYDSLNLAQHVGDNQARVTANRELLRQSMGLPDEPGWLEQTHSTRVVVLELESERVADAAISRKPRMPAVVMTADCLPILLGNKNGSEVAAVHAGWRGLADGVIESTLRTMVSPADQLQAWIGPGISQKHFEIGPEVRQKFITRSAQYDQYFRANRPGHWLCDLSGLARELLILDGVADVTVTNDCTYENEAEFFSYRRNAVTGRMASFIWIEDEE